jgi:hypothetical protein
MFTCLRAYKRAPSSLMHAPHRLLCVRRAGRPLRDFLKPLPSTPSTPHPLPTTNTGPHTRHVLFPPSTQFPPTPDAAHTRSARDPSLDAIAQHLAGWPPPPSAGAHRPSVHRVETLPRYDDKDVLPRYQDVAVVRPPGDLYGHDGESSGGH